MMAAWLLESRSAIKSLQPPLLFLLSTVLPSASSQATISPPRTSPAAQIVNNDLVRRIRYACVNLPGLRNRLIRAAVGKAPLAGFGPAALVLCIILCISLSVLGLWKMIQSGLEANSQDKDSKKSQDSVPSLWEAWSVNADLEAEQNDPGLLQKYSTFKSYTTSKATYPSIRVFFRPHSQADKLPSEPTPLPILVFVHGLGGCLANFSPILTSLINVAPCLGIDLPGCGRSRFAVQSWNAYTPEALAELIAIVVKEFCGDAGKQGIVFVGHSMGCSFSALTATTHFPPQNSHGVNVLGLIGICPQSGPYIGRKLALYRALLCIPTPIFDLSRAMDRRKGPNAPSVTQFAGIDAEPDLRLTQMKFNRQSNSSTFRRMAWGAVQDLPGLQVWSELKTSVLLVAGEADTVTKPSEMAKIAQALSKAVVAPAPVASPTRSTFEAKANGSIHVDPTLDPLSQTETTVLDHHEPPEFSFFPHKRTVLKTCILPKPASHALLYAPSTYRILAGLMQTFLSSHIDIRLSLGWQLQHLSTEGKWDVKNLAKWQSIRPVSEPIAGIFRAMKTLREIDQEHSPERFVQSWKGRIRAVVDISHESPVYDPKGLEEGGIEYHKVPTVSKIPPTEAEVAEFIKLIDRLRFNPHHDSASQQEQGLSHVGDTTDTSFPPPAVLPASGTEQGNDEALIGVHCHYGFNRTGFFIACYLIERLQYPVQRALDTFAAARPKGIKHAHFVDTLFVRYCVGLKRAPTM